MVSPEIMDPTNSLESPSPQSVVPVQPKRRWGRFVLVLVGAVTLIVGVRYFHAQDLLRQILDWAGNSGGLGVGVFIGVYVIATVLMIPGSVLTLGAGAVFGVFWGSLYVSIASTTGATAAFLVSRYIARDRIAERFISHPQFAAIDRAVAQGGWKIVGLTRLSPVFPFTFLNYAFGLTRIGLREYVLASWLGMMPGTVLFVYLGSLATVASGAHQRTIWEWLLYGMGLLATVAVTVVMTRLAKRELSRSVPTR